MDAPRRIQAYRVEELRTQHGAEALPPFTVFFRRDSRADIALLDQSRAGDLDSALDAVRAAFAARGRPLRVELLDALASDLLERLRRRGLVEVQRSLLLACAPDWLRAAPPVAGLSIEVVAAQSPLAAVREGLAINERGFDPTWTGTISDAQANAFRRQLRTGRAFTARLGTLGVGAGMFNAPRRGVTELVGVATLAKHRRRGVATALTAAATREAFTAGVDLVFLVAASESASRVYQRVGFRPVAQRVLVAE
jgi:GNAT superfamily N-acetyltransferase